ncbi:MAG: hypothetical protein IPJ32_18575 [Sphingobacteriaceae bacterium]|nr:hypothetical protein [Sphingobacteriaceae bacterium]
MSNSNYYASSSFMITSTGWATNSLSISYTPSWIIKSIDFIPYLGTCIIAKITVVVIVMVELITVWHLTSAFVYQ